MKAIFVILILRFVYDHNVTWMLKQARKQMHHWRAFIFQDLSFLYLKLLMRMAEETRHDARIIFLHSDSTVNTFQITH